jgi:hypothetical protein
VRSQREMARVLIACALLFAGVSVAAAQELSGQSVFMPDLPINAAPAEFVHRLVDRARSKAPSHTNHGTEQWNHYDDSAGQYSLAARVRHSPGLRSLDH